MSELYQEYLLIMEKLDSCNDKRERLEKQRDNILRKIALERKAQIRKQVMGVNHE